MAIREKISEIFAFDIRVNHVCNSPITNNKLKRTFTDLTFNHYHYITILCSFPLLSDDEGIFRTLKSTNIPAKLTTAASCFKLTKQHI